MDPEPDQNNESTKSMDSLTENEIFPEVQENAIDAVKARQAEKIEQEKTVEPVLTKDGKIAKKRGRKPGGKNSTVHNPRIVSEEKIQQVTSEHAATVVSGILENMQTVMISKDFQYNEVERASNIKAWEATFNHYGGVNLSPPAALALNHMGIILSRVGASSETKTKLQRGGLWFKSKISKIFKRKKYALPDNRSDIERQDNLGDKEIIEPEKTA